MSYRPSLNHQKWGCEGVKPCYNVMVIGCPGQEGRENQMIEGVIKSSFEKEICEMLRNMWAGDKASETVLSERLLLTRRANNNKAYGRLAIRFLNISITSFELTVQRTICRPSSRHSTLIFPRVGLQAFVKLLTFERNRTKARTLLSCQS